MKKCTKCGRAYDAGERFCKSCGTAVSESTTQGARNRIVLTVALLSVIIFSIFGFGVLWLTFKTVQASLHDENINQMLVFADGMSARAAQFLRTGDMDSLRLLQQEAGTNPAVAYSFIRDAEGRIQISTFEGDAVPDALKNVNKLPKGAAFGTQEARVVSGAMVMNVVDVAIALEEGSLGSLHVGLNADMQRNGMRQMFIRIGMPALGLFVLSIGALVLLTSVLTGRILAPVP